MGGAPSSSHIVFSPCRPAPGPVSGGSLTRPSEPTSQWPRLASPNLGRPMDPPRCLSWFTPRSPRWLPITLGTTAEHGGRFGQSLNLSSTHRNLFSTDPIVHLSRAIHSWKKLLAGESRDPIPLLTIVMHVVSGVAFRTPGHDDFL